MPLAVRPGSNRAVPSETTRQLCWGGRAHHSFHRTRAPTGSRSSSGSPAAFGPSAVERPRRPPEARANRAALRGGTRGSSTAPTAGELLAVHDDANAEGSTAGGNRQRACPTHGQRAHHGLTAPGDGEPDGAAHGATDARDLHCPSRPRRARARIDAVGESRAWVQLSRVQQARSTPASKPSVTSYARAPEVHPARGLDRETRRLRGMGHGRTEHLVDEQVQPAQRCISGIESRGWTTVAKRTSKQFVPPRSGHTNIA